MGGITTDLRTGLAFCTRLPVRAPDASLAGAAWTFPLVGAIVGAAGAFAYWLAFSLNLPPAIAATLAVAATALLTGCLHEDGLADTADGLGGGRDVGQALDIMRDSRIGSYGVIVLMLSFLLRIGAIASLAEPGLAAAALIGAHAGARAGIPLFMRAVQPARPDGLSAATGAPTAAVTRTAALLGLFILVVCVGLWEGLLAALVVAGGLLALARLALKKIGGQTGDVLGAAEQIGEILILLTVVALWVR